MLQSSVTFSYPENNNKLVTQPHPLACQPTSFAFLCAAVAGLPFEPILQRVMKHPIVRNTLDHEKVVTPPMIMEIASDMIKENALPITDALTLPATPANLAQPPYTVAVNKLYVKGRPEGEFVSKDEGHRITIIKNPEHEKFNLQYYNPSTGKLYPINLSILQKCVIPNSPLIKVANRPSNEDSMAEYQP